VHFSWKHKQRDINVTESLHATGMRRTRTWNKRKAQTAVAGVATNDHTSEIQRGSCFYVAHIICSVYLWACALCLWKSPPL